jgi:two-component system, OmpR family, sensor histidine kinase MprB
VSLRKRISWVAAAAVAVAVAIAVCISYFAVHHQLLGQIDKELRAQAAAVQRNPRQLNSVMFSGIPAADGGPAQYWQLVQANGDVLPGFGTGLPVSSGAAAVAAGQSAYMSNVMIGGVLFREFTFPLAIVSLGQHLAVQLARPLQPTENVLATLRLILAVVFLAVVALAAGLGRIAARRVLTPLAEVTATAQLIGETDDLTQRLEVRADDEVGQLAKRFNAMLERLQVSRAALDASVAAQRQLVADASHELRTPVTSLRTNIEVLLSDGVLDDADRRQLLMDVVEQSEELSTLVADLIDVARGDIAPEHLEDVRLDRLVESALERARRHKPGVAFSGDLQPVVVSGSAERLMRAINNLLDNASGHTAPGTPVRVSVDGTGVTVRDHGQGISEQDLPHLFDRFYRGENSRSRQGSGLGLAIVRQVAEQHHGTISAANAPDGGAVFTLALPGAVVLDPADATDSAVLDEAGVPSESEVSA